MQHVYIEDLSYLAQESFACALSEIFEDRQNWDYDVAGADIQVVHCQLDGVDGVYKCFGSTCSRTSLTSHSCCQVYRHLRESKVRFEF